IMIGGAAAVLVAWTTYDSLFYPAAVVAILAIVQYLEANVIFPFAVGAQLKINPLATLIAIIVGGIVWGGAGIVLFVPLAAILKILADRIEALKPLGVLLGPEG
ncbi:MAG: AI-2E family transporter, partial [Lewinella sp.]|nr:AI-2E family transporter [Lewinella sp.]